MFDLSGMTALVTGASGGIGSAIARALARQGARLALSGSNAAKLEACAAELGGDHVALACDLADPAAVDGLVPRAAELLGGKLDILVNNAGITRDNLAMRMKDEEWDQVISINLEAAFRLIRAALKPMMKARFGRIVTITSVVGTTGNPGQANYAASKGGLTAMSKALAQEVASRAITVNCVAPGFIASPMTDGLPDAQKLALTGRIPIGRLGEGADVGAAVAFLASREGRLCDRPDAACERRHGDDLRRRKACLPARKRAVRAAPRTIPWGRGDRQMSETAERVKKIVVEHLGVEADKVTEDASFIDDLGADSLDIVELVMAFEEEFGVEIPDDAAEKISTVKDAITYIETHKD